MTTTQLMMKGIYPFLKKITAWLNINNKTLTGNGNGNASFYQLTSILNTGQPYNFNLLQGKKVLIVNTASNCGYTAQYDELEKLYQLKKNEVEIIAFPANDFKEQEKASDEAIASFCKINYGISFALMKKVSVIKNNKQSEVYKWLTDSTQNGWNDKAPNWNFCKYLVNEQGMLTHVFEPSVSPLGTQIMNAVNN